MLADVRFSLVDNRCAGLPLLPPGPQNKETYAEVKPCAANSRGFFNAKKRKGGI